MPTSPGDRDPASPSVSSAGKAGGLDELLKHVSPEEIPESSDLLSPDGLDASLGAPSNLGYDLIAVGDIMLGGRAEEPIAAFGPDYPFQAVQPLLRRAPVVLGNLEGPLAPDGLKQPRNHSYAVKPERGGALSRAGINVVTLANNHLMDCGREGVLRTLEAVERAGVAAIGAGPDERSAHAPVIRTEGRLRLGFLGYYWNRRCAAGRTLPGGAIDTPDRLEADIRGLRGRVDRVVVTFHWGIPYEREPLAEDRVKARFAIDCGADLVIGHHPHCIQPFEIHRGRPIFYSVGNFAFGSGNSRAEGLLLGVRFGEGGATDVDVFALYVKNRDPRVNYQPMVLRGRGAERVLALLAGLSGRDGKALRVEAGRGRLTLD